MSEISFEGLAVGLRGWVRSGTAHEQAAIELLIWHETWLRRPDFKGACITQRAAGLVAIINWEEAREFIDRGYRQPSHPGLPAASSQRRLLDFAVALGENMFGLSGMGMVHQWHMAAAFAKACGCTLEGPIPEPGHNHPDFIPGDPLPARHAPRRPRTRAAPCRAHHDPRAGRAGTRHRQGAPVWRAGGRGTLSPRCWNASRLVRRSPRRASRSSTGQRHTRTAVIRASGFT